MLAAKTWRRATHLFNTRRLEDATVEELETRAADIPESDSAEE